MWLPPGAIDRVWVGVQAELARRGPAVDALGGAETAALQERVAAAEAERDKARLQLSR